MAATLGEPYLLASYEYSASKSGESSHVYAHTSRGLNGETLVTVSVQQDSVYLLDVSHLLPV